MTAEGSSSEVCGRQERHDPAKAATIRDRLVIRPLEAKDSIREVTDLLHLAFKSDGQQPYAYPAASQSEEETRMQVTRGACWVAELDGRLIGIGVVWPPRPEARQWWHLSRRSAHLRQLAVHPDFHSLGVGTRLLDRCEQSAVRMGAWQLDGVSPIGSRQLHLYLRRGFRIIEYVVREDTNYNSVVFSRWVQKDRRPGIMGQIMARIKLCDTFVAYKLGLLGRRRRAAAAVLHGLRSWVGTRGSRDTTGRRANVTGRTTTGGT